MRKGFILFLLFLLAINIISCKKRGVNSNNDCYPDAAILRQISNKTAVVKVTATIDAVYLVEQGAIDTKLIPCNLPMEYFQNNLQVTISGVVKARSQTAASPCCTESLVITTISR